MRQGNNVQHSKKCFLVALLLVFCIQIFSCFQCFAVESEQYVSLNSSLKNGELPTVTSLQNYKEFESNGTIEDIVFMSDYRPVNLLSSKENPSKASFLQNSSVFYNTEHSHQYMGLVTTIY